ncbi:hypothetical protein QYM36_016447 [Artemia franciscana]|uniref:Uncharacterized protein n=1 Tax=Artemia franciscana TaxID=6661 RepID=A0AA88H7Q1_ARTSF|nr:hypothetical protein QYM36_016447 [Artemia franciscana]
MVHGDMDSSTNRKAADYFQGEESNASARNCLLKVGDQAAVMKNYDKAIGIFEKVATKALDDKLSQYSAKDYFFRAAICRLCNSSEPSEAALEANLAIQRYEQQYPAFQDSREYKLIKDITSALEEQNKEHFVNKLQDFDSISRLNPWQTKLFNRVKELFNDEEDLK